MREPPVRRALGEVPPERVPRRPPASRRVGAVPSGDPLAQRPAGRPPNPRPPLLARDAGGGPMRDLFDMFPDLPRPPRPAPRLRGRVKRRVQP